MSLDAFSVLLTLSSFTQDELSVYVALLHNSTAAGAIDATSEEVRKAHNQMVDGRRMKKETFVQAIRSLREKGALPSLSATYPLAFSPEEEERERVEKILTRLEEDTSQVRPSRDRPGHERLFAAFRAADVLEIAIKEKRTVLRDPKTGDPVVAAGQQHRYKQKKWAYAFVQKLIKNHSVEQVIEAVFSLYITGKWGRLRDQHEDWEGRRRAYRKYLTGTLQEGSSSTESLSEESRSKEGEGGFYDQLGR